MPLNITVVPGHVFADGELVVTASLNALGQPVITITGSVGGSEIAAGGVNSTHVQPGPFFHALASGSANAYVVTLAPAPAALADGLWFSFRANHANTGPATVNVNGLGAKALVTPAREALVGGEITSGQEVWVQYDGAQFQITSPRSIPMALYAVDTGVPDAYVIALAGISVSALAQLTGIPITFKAAAACTGASTLAVNGLVATAITKKGTTALSANDIQTGQAVTVVFDGTQFQIVGAMDAPALPAVGSAGTTVYPFSITRDIEGRVIAISGGVNTQTSAVPAAGGTVSFAHGLGRVPAFVDVRLVNVTGEYNYTPGRELAAGRVTWKSGDETWPSFSWDADATTVRVVRYDSGGLYAMNATTGGFANLLTDANWQLKIYAW